MTKLISYFNNLNKILDDIEIKEILDSYNDWVDRQYSIINDDYNVSRPHHVRTPNNSGTAMKPHDLWKVPITYPQHTDHHTKGMYQFDFLGKLPELHRRFLNETNLDWLKGMVEK